MVTPDRSATTQHPATWGASRQMTEVEALMWRAEVDPRLRSDGVVMDLLDSTPDWDRLVQAHEWGTRLAPRLRQRVQEVALRLGTPRWVSTELDLGHHLTRVRLADPDALLDVAQALHEEPFDTARPLWKAVLVEGLPEGKSAYLLKFHHAMADGAGAMQLFDLVHSDRSEPRPDKTAPPVPEVEQVGAADLAVQRIAGVLRTAPRTAALGLAGLLGNAARTAVAPHDAVVYARSLARVTAAAGTPSPLMRHRGVDRRLRMLEVDFAALQVAGRAAGGSLNDAYLAALLGGLRRYHDKHGTEVGDLPVALPVSLREGGHSLGGNRFAGAYIAGPAGEVDAAARVGLVRRRVLKVRREPALDFLGATAPIVSRLPPALLASLSLRFSSAIDLQASNIPGMRREAYIAGARIERMFVFGPVPGCAVMATLLSHGGTCCVGIVTDHDAVPDPDVLLDCFAEGFAEVLALGAPR